ncbi:transporter substrate-binding domain-containing protein [Jiella pacifica]|uniref:Transporter substrate-binding domain-containing protein n=1 Tax=Jiella pacifica TaxID=2696469 RepID=A0A6N9T8Z4_9HYPH|nr:transporter substrate-binding domain-containing protein [Jiella pacifica]NDW07914.1 transporter substrate-binding domain-containing protein [Jiella pacifica]
MRIAQAHSLAVSRTLLTLLAGVCTVALATVAQARDGKITRIAVEGGFPPFNYLDAENQLQGFDVEVARALCAKANLSCEFVMQGWEDMIPNLNADRYDAIVSSMSKSEERMKLVDFTDSYYTSPSVFVVRKKTEMPDFQSKSLGGLALGVALGTVQAAYVEQTFPDAKVTIFPSSPDLYKGLADGSIDVVFEDKLAIYDWLTNTRAGNCCEFKGPDIIDPKFFGDGAGIAVRKTDTELREKLNVALAAITADGTYDAINAKYFPFSIR